MANTGVGLMASTAAGPARDAAMLSAKMDFVSAPDAAPSEALNRILWHTAKGWDVPYPGVKVSLFFPMAVDLADSERDLDDEPVRQQGTDRK